MAQKADLGVSGHSPTAGKYLDKYPPALKADNLA
jgi:hypothetical protein